MVTIPLWFIAALTVFSVLFGAAFGVFLFGRIYDKGHEPAGSAVGHWQGTIPYPPPDPQVLEAAMTEAFNRCRKGG